MNNGNDNNSVMSVKDWIITSLIFLIPCVNIVMLFVWAFGDGNINRKNYCRASLILTGILLTLYIILIIAFVILGGSLAAIGNALS